MKHLKWYYNVINSQYLEKTWFARCWCYTLYMFIICRLELCDFCARWRHIQAGQQEMSGREAHSLCRYMLDHRPSHMCRSVDYVYCLWKYTTGIHISGCWLFIILVKGRDPLLVVGANKDNNSFGNIETELRSSGCKSVV